MTDPNERWQSALRDMDRLLTAVAEDARTSRRAPKRRIWPWAGVAAAAAAAGVLFIAGSGNSSGSGTESVDPQPASEAGAPPLSASLEAEAPRPFIVLQTEDPQIAVVWLLEETS